MSIRPYNDGFSCQAAQQDIGHKVLSLHITDLVCEGTLHQQVNSHRMKNLPPLPVGHKHLRLSRPHLNLGGDVEGENDGLISLLPSYLLHSMNDFLMSPMYPVEFPQGHNTGLV